MYEKATEHYISALKTESVAENDKADFFTNILACSANDVSQSDKIQNLMSEMNASQTAAQEAVYELFFNQS